MKIKCLLLFIITSNILAYSIIIPTNASNNIPLSIEGTANIKGNIINVSPLSPKIDWRYKVINGILYKRLYDYTNKRWIGNWIRV